MPLEAGNFIPELNANNPLGSDAKSEGDDHLRLIKRATQGSFPAFVGSTATPKSVSLTEDQVNDAALQSEAASITGAWVWAADLTIGTLQRLLMVDDNTFPQVVLDYDGLILNMGSSNRRTRINGETRIDFAVDGVITAKGADIASGGMIVLDRNSAERKAGLRNPGFTNIAANRTIVQNDEGLILRLNLNGIALEFATMEVASAGMILTGPTISGCTLVEEIGTTLRWADGSGTVVTGTRNMAGNSVAQWSYLGANSVTLWGNGLS